MVLRLRFFLLISLFVLSCASTEVSLSLKDDESIELLKAQVLRVDLQANPTTGYNWQVVEKSNQGILSQLGEPDYVSGSSAKEGLVGAGGIQTYRFKAVKSGKAIILFEYKRAWEGDQEPAKKYLLEVIVK